jgi:concanavalin A-like lectin/glucanase superfamily protein
MMMLGLVAVAAVMQQQAKPVLWLDLQGNITIAGKPVEPRYTTGASPLETTLGTVYSFTGDHGAMLFQDPQPLKLTGSITVSTWLFLRSYVKHGSNAQILFRGDDRGGLDPYSLRIEHDNVLAFQIQDAQNVGASVKASFPLGKWVHIVASFNDKNGELAMWLNGEPIAHTFTHIRPFGELDQGQTPGVAVGNVQHDGPDNEPLNGLVGDLRLYSGVWGPKEVGFNPTLGDQGSTR